MIRCPFREETNPEDNVKGKGTRNITAFFTGFYTYNSQKWYQNRIYL